MGTSTLQANCTSRATTHNSTIQLHVELFQLSVYIPTFVLGFLFNGMAMTFAFRWIRQLTEPVIYMMSLMILDTLMLFVLPFKIISYHKEWDLGNVFCSFLESLYFVNMYGSILISTCICADRYIAILHPFAAITLRSPRKAVITCGIMSAGVWAGTAYTYNLHDNTCRPKYCFRGFSSRFWENSTLFIILEVGFLSCMAIMIFCTAEIIKCLSKSRRLGDPLMNKSKSINIIVANLATFVVCFTPFHVALVLYYLAKNSFLDDSQEIVRTFLQISLCWANLNCFLDAIGYYFVFSEFLKLFSSGDELRTTTTE